MSKGNRRKVGFIKPKTIPPVRKPAAAPDYTLMRSLPPQALADGINNLLQVLDEKGVHVYDFDRKTRRLYKIQMVRSQLYFLAADPDPEEGDRDGPETTDG